MNQTTFDKKMQEIVTHTVLQTVESIGYLHLKRVTAKTRDVAERFGKIFQPLAKESPIVTMKIEGNDPVNTPYASCRTPALSLHTDYATFPKPPRFTLTHCIEPDPGSPPGGASIVLLLKPVFDHLKVREPELLALLRRDVFPFHRNAEHSLYHSSVPTFPILDEQMRVRFDRTLILPHLEKIDTRESQELRNAVAGFEQLCEQRANRLEIVLNKDEVLLIDNRRTLHSRSECEVLYDGDVLRSREVNLAFLE